jgi:putative hemolysin
MADASTTPGDPFALQFAHQTRLVRAAIRAARPFVSAVLGLRTCRRLYTSIDPAGRRERFAAAALEALGIRVRVLAESPLPSRGALIVAANHPTGVRDGLALLAAVRERRPDVRILANSLLASVPELHDLCFFVDPFGGPEAAAHSHAGLRAAHLWLRRGGALIVFPSGSVASTLAANASAFPIDDEWLPTVGRLALATLATVVPAFLDGRNSALFYLAGRLHPRLRTVLLGRALLDQRGSTAAIRLGRVLPPARLAQAGGAAAVAAFVRAECDALRDEGPAPGEIAPPVSPALLARDVEALPPDARLLTSGPYDVFCARAEALPHVLPEIGRLREVTFRAVGEGTGLSRDLDRFDEHYEHLFVWHRGRQELVGAYRIGATDRIGREHGASGLYTTTLFRYDERLLRMLPPALELGRSFVRAEYQRTYNALLLLWKGIGRYLGRHSRYRVLYGPVSISSRYRDSSQQLLRRFLAEYHRADALAELVEPINPPVPLTRPDRERPPADVDQLDALVSRLEGGAGVPVLLRQYLRLNARLLGFNIDPAFGDALDALMMVDLDALPPSTLRRYLGAEADAFARARTPRAA